MVKVKVVTADRVPASDTVMPISTVPVALATGVTVTVHSPDELNTMLSVGTDVVLLEDLVIFVGQVTVESMSAIVKLRAPVFSP